MPSQQTGFQWNVQPYRWLYELRDNYTTTVINATRKKAPGYAKDITEWMKMNAPWKDKTLYYPGRDKNGNRRVKFKAGTARQSLVAEFVDPFQDFQFIEMAKQLRKLEARDTRQLAVVNKERRKAGAIALNKLPASQSQAAQYRADVLRNVAPIVNLRLRYEGDVPHAVWLEIAHQGRWGIISKAIGYWQPKLLGEVKRNAKLVQFRNHPVVQEFQTEMANQITPEQKFANYVASETKGLGKEYKPWSPDIKKEKQRRKRYRRYGPEKRGYYNVQE